MKRKGKALVYPVKSDTDCKSASLHPFLEYIGNGKGAGAQEMYNAINVKPKNKSSHTTAKKLKNKK